MIGYDWTYKGVNLWNSDGIANRIGIIDVNKNLSLRTTIFPKQNYHGANKTNTLADGRLFTFTFQIFGNRAERAAGQALLNSIIVPEFNPVEGADLYPLNWNEDSGERVTAQASVFSVPQYDSVDPGSTVLRGTFELYAPNPFFKSTTTKTNSGDYGKFGGFKLPVKMPFAMNEILGEVVVNNAGNFGSQVRIEVRGNIENPVIKNLTTGVFYGLDRTTTNLIIDNTGSTLVVTDEGVDVRADRKSGSGIILLQPGNNTLILTGDNFDYESTVEWDIFYQDTYST